jgi:norsolorinic acid ketoreductase
MSNTTYFITGANRGIGKGLVAHYLGLSHNTVIAGVRNPDNPSSVALSSLPVGEGSKIILVKIENVSETDAHEAVKLLQSKFGITKIDVVLAVAGILNYYGLAKDTPTKEFIDHFHVNVVGPLLLFQATLPLLEAAKNPKFVTIGTFLGSIGEIRNAPFTVAAYGSSKAALHYLTVKIASENPKLIAFPIHPG